MVSSHVKKYLLCSWENIRKSQGTLISCHSQTVTEVCRARKKIVQFPNDLIMVAEEKHQFRDILVKN